MKFLQAVEREHQRRATEAIRFAVTDSTAGHQQAWQTRLQEEQRSYEAILSHGSSSSVNLKNM